MSKRIYRTINVRDQMQAQAINHQFFLLTRQQKYQEAYDLGTFYLQYHPENRSIADFCQFIKHNHSELIQMVRDQQEYTDNQSSQEEEEEDSEEEEERKAEAYKSGVKKVQTKKSEWKRVFPEVRRPGGAKESSEVCRYHKWSHVCKKVNCPNKKNK